MKHRRIFNSDDAALDEYLKNIRVVWEIRHKNIAQIHYFKNNTRKYWGIL